MLTAAGPEGPNTPFLHASLQGSTIPPGGGNKGILLAGGAGSRMYPLTRLTSKQLLPVYDKPMVYYPLTTLLQLGVREVALISTPRDVPYYAELLGDGGRFGIRIQYLEQPRPEGLAQAYLIARDFLAGDASIMILGDNVFHGPMDGIQAAVAEFAAGNDGPRGGLVFGYPVRDPERYGVVEFDAAGRVLSLEEKPKKPRSHFAVPGLYVFDGRAPEIAAGLKPSARGELEIIDIQRHYWTEGSLRVRKMDRGMAWLDTGTPKSLQEAAAFIEAIESRQGLKVGCPEEEAARRGFFPDRRAFTTAVLDALPICDYRRYLEQVADEVFGAATE